MTTEEKLFSRQQRNENGWLIYPGRDTEWRKDLYGPYYEETRLHPAKMRMEVCRDIIHYVSCPGETILDPFGGIGTTMIAALSGRNVVLLEVEQVFADIAQRTADWLHSEGMLSGAVTVICQDNRQVLPLPCNHIITSPPYGNDLSNKSPLEGTEFYEGSDRMKRKVEAYTASPLNIGTVNKFMYVKTMDRLYKKMIDSLPPGGTISITHRDRIEDGKRVTYAMEIIRAMTTQGMEILYMDKWDAPTSVQNTYNKSQGLDVVTEEDILIFRKVYNV